MLILPNLLKFHIQLQFKGEWYIMNLLESFHKGITKEKYMERLDYHRDAFEHIYNNFSVPQEDESLFNLEKDVKVIALAAEWCGHCMMDVPILLRITEKANLPTRFLVRDDHLDVMDQYLTNGKRYIPIFIFIDENGNELAKWGPMAPEISDFSDRLKENLPEKESPEYDQAFKQFIKEIGSTFRNDETFWNYVYEDLKKTITSIK